MLEIEGYVVAPTPVPRTTSGTFNPSASAASSPDVRMPGMSGLELQTQRLEARDGCRSFFSRANADVEVAGPGAFQGGAVDFDEARRRGAARRHQQHVHRDVLRRLGVTRPERIAEGAAQLRSANPHASMICRRLTDAQVAGALRGFDPHGRRPPREALHEVRGALGRSVDRPHARHPGGDREAGRREPGADD